MKAGPGSSKGMATSHAEAGSGAEGSLPCVYPVWYRTNRRRADPSDPTAGYSADRESTDFVHYGRCLVSIPRSHRFGSVGSSWWRRWLTGTDDRLRVVERAEFDRDAFWTALWGEIAQGHDEGQQALVYLHGYNVPFDEAAIRAGQIGFDLKVPDAMAFFSWPSQGSLGGYASDEASIEASEHAIADFLVRLATDSGASRVHVIAHSMGNRGLLRAVQRIIAQASATSGVRFGQVLLAAPDLDTCLFRDLATIYPRISELDLSILGHAYFAEAHGVLYDMHQLLNANAAPDSRLRLHARQSPDGRRYWAVD
jgi:esterase/lipase superfamily enzyme